MTVSRQLDYTNHSKFANIATYKTPTTYTTKHLHNTG